VQAWRNATCHTFHPCSRLLCFLLLFQRRSRLCRSDRSQLLLLREALKHALHWSTASIDSIGMGAFAPRRERLPCHDRVPVLHCLLEPSLDRPHAVSIASCFAGDKDTRFVVRSVWLAASSESTTSPSSSALLSAASLSPNKSTLQHVLSFNPCINTRCALMCASPSASNSCRFATRLNPNNDAS
jgi:hypothetical protein